MDEPDEPAELAERRAALYAEIRELIEPLPRELVSYRVMLVLAHPSFGSVPPFAFVQQARNDARRALSYYLARESSS
jgi:hypothetical protein